MKVVTPPLVLLSVFFFSHSAQAGQGSKNLKSKAHHCAVFKNNAQKAKSRYGENRRQAEQLFTKIKKLQKNQQRLPANVQLAKKVVNRELEKLSLGKKQKLVLSLKYLEKHILYSRAAQRNCTSKPKPSRQLRKKPVRSFPLIADGS